MASISIEQIIASISVKRKAADHAVFDEIF